MDESKHSPNTKVLPLRQGNQSYQVVPTRGALGLFPLDRTNSLQIVGIDLLAEWEAPTKVTELRFFLGLANYCRRFIEGYSRITALLTDMLKKGKVWDWNPQCERAFNQLK
ncbi:uncharacterized mitochondrial protein AtMg00860-like [Gossypium arboreum]|uniref:uncharacterized mitochondrial protein AtMg00860-like n=1 Tax=Gossypium arboreum TaxID=29729 RepID=UPI0008193688|nr:uncharacterized mitochondrial protein AtMg00860-like [Gossypium arboreum]